MQLGFFVLNQNNDPFNAFEAKTEAQKLSFAPIVFHTARTLRDLGILAALDSAGSKGMFWRGDSESAQHSKAKWSKFALS